MFVQNGDAASVSTRNNTGLALGKCGRHQPIEHAGAAGLAQQGSGDSRRGQRGCVVFGCNRLQTIGGLIGPFRIRAEIKARLGVPDVRLGRPQEMRSFNPSGQGGMVRTHQGPYPSSALLCPLAPLRALQ